MSSNMENASFYTVVVVLAAFVGFALGIEFFVLTLVLVAIMRFFYFKCM